MSANTCTFHSSSQGVREATTGLPRVEVREPAKHPTVHSTAPQQRIFCPHGHMPGLRDTDLEQGPICGNGWLSDLQPLSLQPRSVLWYVQDTMFPVARSRNYVETILSIKYLLLK